MTKNVFTSSSFGLAPERTARRNALEAAIIKVFEQYGYSEVSLPIYEYYDVLKTITHDFKDENIISFTDRTSGRLLVLRPDFTPQVCRMVAGYKRDFPLPIRVYYRGTVFRNVNIDQGARAEKYQIGCELYGTKEIAGDLELLLCVNASMKKAGIENFRVVFGDAAFMSKVMELLGTQGAIYRDIIINKRLYELEGFVESLGLGGEVKKLLKKLGTAFGGVKVLDNLADLSSFDPCLQKRALYLKEFFNQAVELGFDEEKIVFDAAEVRGLDYYTGINFDVLNTKTGASFGGGGRYDTLMEKFRVDYTACGMALYLSEIESEALYSPPSVQADWIVVGSENLPKAEQLRAQGYTVIHLFDKEDLDAFSTAVKANNIYGDK